MSYLSSFKLKIKSPSSKIYISKLSCQTNTYFLKLRINIYINIRFKVSIACSICLFFLHFLNLIFLNA